MFLFMADILNYKVRQGGKTMKNILLVSRLLTLFYNKIKIIKHLILKGFLLLVTVNVQRVIIYENSTSLSLAIAEYL